jgi:hypothetical protein
MEVYGLFACLSDTSKTSDVFIISPWTGRLFLVLDKTKPILLDPYTTHDGTTACCPSSAYAYIIGFAMRLSSILQARSSDD